MKAVISDSFTRNEKQNYFRNELENYDEKYKEGVENVIEKRVKHKNSVEKDDKHNIWSYWLIAGLPFLGYLILGIENQKEHYMFMTLTFFLSLGHIAPGILNIIEPELRKIFFDGLKRIYTKRFKRFSYEQIFIVQQTLWVPVWIYIYIFFIDWNFLNEGSLRIGFIAFALMLSFGFKFIKALFASFFLFFVKRKLISPTLEGESFSEAVSLLGFKLENLTYKAEMGTILNEKYRELAQYPAGIAFYTKPDYKKNVKFVLYFERFNIPELNQIKNNKLDFDELKCSGIYYVDRRKKQSDEIGIPIPRVIPAKDVGHWMNENAIMWIEVNNKEVSD